jgi:hypothetical protein
VGDDERDGTQNEADRDMMYTGLAEAMEGKIGFVLDGNANLSG